ncbi:MAG: tetratricopeptide repeat protein [Burkholderiales bacterium]|nr:tetratricopeptide repeat protein [Burkholderiales bacterium]
MHRNRLRPSLRRAALLLSVLCLPLAASADDIIDNARALLDKQNSTQAYELLAPLASDRAGEPAFDYLLGLAALDTNRNTEAVFALERVLAVQPENVAARAAIARAYLKLKESDAAKREFQNVKRTDPPPEVVSAVDRFLSEIDRLEARNRNSLRMYVEGFFGTDSNVNSATADRSIAVPIFGGQVFNLAPGGSALQDSFHGLQGGLNFRLPQSQTWALIGSATANRRWNHQFNEFDTGFLDLAFGASRRKDKDTITILGQYNDFHVQNPAFPNVFRNAVGGSLQWQRDIDLRNQLTGFLQMAQVAYPDQKLRDVNRWVVGGGWAHAYRAGPIVFASAYAGQEVALDKAFAYVGHDLAGVRVGTEIPSGDRVRFFGNAAYERRNFAGQEPLFLATRHDDQYTAVVGLHYTPVDAWRVSPQLFWIRNDASLQLFTFDRAVAEVRVRREF